MPVEVGAPKNNLSFLAKSCATVLQVWRRTIATLPLHRVLTWCCGMT